jgi:hypothetical protein
MPSSNGWCEVRFLYAEESITSAIAGEQIDQLRLRQEIPLNEEESRQSKMVLQQ